MKLRAWGCSDVGRKRDHNEDSLLLEPNLGLFAVADGMGGHLGGDRASRMAVEILGREVKRLVRNGAMKKPAKIVTENGDEGPVAAALRQAARTAGAAIFDVAQREARLHGMGTTLTALLVRDDKAYVAHVGDSRAYLFRDGKAQQVTEDHSWIAEQVRAGLLSEEEARDSRFRHIITRSVGFEREVQVDLQEIPISPGDCFLLCSDGLTNHIEDTEIGRILTAEYYRRAPQVFVEIANERGGDDNVTVLVVYVANEKAAEESPTTEPDEPDAADELDEDVRTQAMPKPGSNPTDR
jgi:protein phosphatase